MKTFILTAQKNMNTAVLTLGLSSVRSDYQYGWNMPAYDKNEECALMGAIIAGFRKLHTASSGSFHNRFSAERVEPVMI